MKSLIGLFLVLFATQAVTQELSSTLHSTLYGVQVAYVDEMVIFTCVVRGSDSMAWRSEEYIGAGGQQLPFAAAEPANRTQRAIGNAQTVATLITADNTGDRLIISELRIRIESTYPIAEVRCISSGVDVPTVNSTSFQLAAALSVTCDRQFLCPGEMTITCVCATGNSNVLAWTVNGTRIEFTSNNALLAMRDIPGSSGFAVLTENSIVNGIRVLMSNITLGVSSSDITLTCQNVNQSVTTPVTVPIIESCPTNPSVTTSTETERITGDCAGPITAAVVVPVVIMTVIAILVGIIVYMYFRVKLAEKERNISVLETKLMDALKDEMNGKLSSLREEKDALIQMKEVEIASLRKSIMMSEQRELQENLLRLKNEMSQKQAAMKHLNETIHQQEKQLQAMNSQLTEKTVAMEEMQRKMYSMGQQIGELKKRYGKLETKNGELELQNRQIGQQIGEVKKKNGELELQNRQINSQLLKKIKAVERLEKATVSASTGGSSHPHFN